MLFVPSTGDPAWVRCSADGRSAIASRLLQRRSKAGGRIRARTIPADQAFGDYLELKGVGGLLRRAASAASLPMIAAATPGLEHLLVLGKIKELERERAADLIVVDAPPAGHAAPFLRSASGLSDVVKSGPVREQADEVSEMLADPERCQALLVALPEETPITEVIELADELGDDLGIALLPLVVNACWPDRPGLDEDAGDGGPLAQDQAVRRRPSRRSSRAAAFGRSRLEQQREQIDASDRNALRADHHAAASGDATARRRRSRRCSPMRSLGLVGAMVTVVTDARPRPGVVARRRASRTPQLLAHVRPGGVGKTTTAAALGVAAARAGRRTVVVTVDPARRLADALGLGRWAGADEPHRVKGVHEARHRRRAVGADARRRADVRPPRPRSVGARKKQADAVLNNPVYQAISGSLSGAQEYMAIERLHQLHTSGDWDLVIVDTPPSRHAIDLLEAPDRLIGFLSHPVYRTLTVGQRAFAKITDAAASMFLWAVKRLAGPQIVEDTIEFFRSLANIEGGLRTRAKEVSALLRDDGTTFIVVSSPRAEAVGEAEHLIDALHDKGFPFAGVVVNLIHPMPEPLSDDDAELLADLDDGPLADHVAWHDELTELATAERAELVDLDRARRRRAVVEFPLLDVDIHDVPGLVDLPTSSPDRPRSVGHDRRQCRHRWPRPTASTAQSTSCSTAPTSEGRRWRSSSGSGGEVVAERYGSQPGERLPAGTSRSTPTRR